MTYVTQPVVRTTLVQTVTAEGTVNPQNLILVGTQVPGTISELDVDYNSPVRVGQVMAKLDPTTFRDALAGAGASHGQFTQQYGAGIAAAQSAAASVSSDSANVAAARAALASGTRTLRSLAILARRTSERIGSMRRFSRKRAGCLRTLAVAACVTFGTPLAARPLPACPTVNVSLLATIDTKIAKPGEIFRFQTVAPVALGTQLIAAGTQGVGLIEVLDHSKSNGHSGYLVLDARFLALADGAHVPVAFVPGTNGQSFANVGAGSSDAPDVIGYIPYYIGTAARVYNYFHHGKDAAVTAGTQMPLVVGDGIETETCAAPVAGPSTTYPTPHF